jgi:hypothetical protein
MKYWIKIKTIEYDRIIDPMSIGIVSEDDRNYYAINYDCSFSKSDKYTQDNILAYFPFKPIHPKSEYGQSGEFLNTGVWRRIHAIGKDVLNFIDDDDHPVFWTWCGAYDWVALCHLLGGRLKMPANFPSNPNDLKQEYDRLGNPELKEYNSTGGSALDEAKWCKFVYNQLQSLNGNI